MTEVLILGAGVIGLSTALALLERGHTVTVWTRDPIAATTSAVAAAIWLPYLAEPRERVLLWSQHSYERLCELAAHTDTGVRLMTVREVFASPPQRPWWADAVRDLRPVPVAELPAGLRSGFDATVPFCDTRVFLPWLQARVLELGGHIEVRTVRNLDDVVAQHKTVVNCTGLGARELCGDASLRGVRGQVVRVRGASLPHALIDDTDASPCYLLPRGDELVLGGTAQMDDERVAADPADTGAILDSCARHLPAVHAASITSIAVGLRPWRPTVRLERQVLARRPDGTARCLLHNYGHGGSGFTLAFGCAREIALLLADNA